MAKSYEWVSDPALARDSGPTFLAIGVFDGVHLGHQRLLQGMVAEAKTLGARPAALTFFPHPSKVLRGRQGRLYLCTLEERVTLLAEQGVELIVTHPFDEAVRRTTAADFIDGLCQNLELKQIWGGNFSLGYNREGDLPFLRQMGRAKGFTVHQVEALVQWNGQEVSSSRVRHSLANGDIHDVSGCLGRRYRLTGTIVPGDGRGKELGIPTANLKVWDELILPANGVYATYAWLHGQRHLAATNVGYRPTVNGHGLNVEAHLLEFDQDIYDQQLTLEFVERIRDEQKFSSLDVLVQQIRADIVQIRGLLELDDSTAATGW